MKFVATIVGLALAARSFAYPSAEKRQTNPPHVTVANLTFHGGPAEYYMSIPADGQTYETNNDIAVNIIDTPTYNAYSQCTFNTAGEKTIVQSIGPDHDQQLIIGPPQPIISVSCEGFCLPVYAECYGYFGPDGEYYGPLGPCCNGYCAANRCRPWY